MYMHLVVYNIISKVHLKSPVCTCICWYLCLNASILKKQQQKTNIYECEHLATVVFQWYTRLNKLSTHTTLHINLKMLMYICLFFVRIGFYADVISLIYLHVTDFPGYLTNSYQFLCNCVAHLHVFLPFLDKKRLKEYPFILYSFRSIHNAHALMSTGLTQIILKKQLWYPNMPDPTLLFKLKRSQNILA